jgi:hypothetical protein
MKVLLDSCIWGGAKRDLNAAGFDVVWVGDFLKDPVTKPLCNYLASKPGLSLPKTKTLVNWPYSVAFLILE